MSEKHFVSVGTRLAASTAAVICLFSLAVFFGLSAYQWNKMVEGRAASAREVMSLFAELVAAPLVFADTKSVEDAVKYMLRNPDLRFARVTGIDAEGLRTVAHQYVRPDVGREEPLQDAPGTRYFDDRVVVDEVVKDTDGNIVGGATLSFALTREIQAYARLRGQILFGAAGISLVLIAVLVFVARRRVVKPLARLTYAVQKLESGELVDVATDSQDEVGSLAGAFIRMAMTIRQREQLIARRNRDMKLVLDNVSQGFVVIDSQARLAGERSSVADRWFGVPADAQLLVDWLATHDAHFRDLFTLGWEQLVERALPRAVCLDQLPRTLKRDGTTWSIEYQIIADDRETWTQMMIVLTDVTAEIQREAAERVQHELVEIFQRLSRDRSGFVAFVQDGRAMVDALGHDPSLSAAEHFRLVHTLKGNCAMQGIQSVALVCHGVESRLADERGRVTAQEHAAINANWGRFEAQVRRLSGGDRDIVEVEGGLVRDLQQRIARGRPHAELQDAMSRWSQESVRKQLERLAERATSLALKLGKGEPLMTVECDDTRLPPGSFGGFWSALVHVVRNAVDHGLQARSDKGVAGVGQLTFSARDRGGVLEVEIADSGRGVAWDKVAQKAAARGLATATQADLVNALFSDGLSTRDFVTETSGRGVGLGAVRTEVERAGGTVTVESKPGEGTRFVFRLPIAQATGRHAA